MKILTIGLGFIASHLPYDKLYERVPINSGYIEYMLARYKPDILINCIGKTGHPNIDWCELHKEETVANNIALPILLAEECAKHSIHLIQIGSGCIYFGESPNFHYVQADGTPMPDNSPPGVPYTIVMTPCKKIDDGWREEDFANPQSLYSKSKYACDLALGQMKHVTTLRIRMPISPKNHPRNLINKLRGYKQIINIPNSMTFMDDLVRCIAWTIDKLPGGIFHVVNPQPLTAVRLMQEYQKYEPTHNFEAINEQQLDQLTVAKRSNCILDSQKLIHAGFQMTNSEEALSQCMSIYDKNIRSLNVE